MRRFACILAIVPVMAVAACQSGPDLLTTKLASLAPDKGPPAPQANSKSPAALGRANEGAAPCPKDFWGSCKAAATLPDKGQAAPTQKVASPQPAPAQAAPCPKDFWGNCKAAPAEAEKEPLIKVALTTAIAPPVTDASPATPCAKDFWGSCKLVAVKPHVYLWNYSKSDTTKANLEVPKKSEPEKRIEPVVLNRREVAAHSSLCHPRRRVVGEERTSREHAQQAADDAWMGEVRYDFGERYQDLNKAKDVRHNCNPSTISSALKSSQFRCAVEATPCRAPIGLAEKR